MTAQYPRLNSRLILTCMAGAAALATPSQLLAQQDRAYIQPATMTVTGYPPSDLEGLEEGPEVKGFISARGSDRIQVLNEEGAGQTLRLSEATEVRAKKGFLGLGSENLSTASLYNGLPVTVSTVRWNGGLIARKIRFSGSDLKTASMIRNGTAQGFAEQTAATDALRGRVGDIDQYNIKGTTNVYFDTNKWRLSAEAERDLCNAAAQANSIDNALLLVVGYTDSTGSQDYNQQLSEKRAGRVVNYLQQACGWKPWRMLTPTGMSESNPAADNETAYGKAQNRRVAVNIMVSKSVDGL